MYAAPSPDLYASQRQQMVDLQLRQRGIGDARVLAAMSKVPRHEFVPAESREQSYEDHPIPIGEGQTISQPYIVGITLEALRLSAEDIVLEVGTGSGYQTALLAELAAQVYSIERLPYLASRAQSALSQLGYQNVTVVVGDGSLGLSMHAPYDAIVVSAAAPQMPLTLFSQLKESGRMLVPVGPSQAQELQLVIKQDGRPAAFSIGACRFVPLIGAEAYSSE